jgi:hypothetical protein
VRRFVVTMLVAATAHAAVRPGEAPAQVAAPALKAAFLYNFAKFTGWPADALASGARLVLCSTDAVVGGALGATTAGRSIDGHAIETRHVDPSSEALHECHLLYVGDLPSKVAGPLLEGLQRSPVLTVGDRDDFVESGGIIRLFLEEGQMRFAVSVASAERARVQLSSKILSLARLE